MAITIKSSPGAYSSANKGLYHVVTSSNSTQPNFKFVFDVLINNITIASIKLFFCSHLPEFIALKINIVSYKIFKVD